MNEPVAPRRVLVAGDLVVDHYFYEGERHKPVADEHRGVRHVMAVGGAKGIVTLLASLAETDRKFFEVAEAARTAAGGDEKKIAPQRQPIDCIAALGVVPPREDHPVGAHHAFALWRPFPLTRDRNEKRKVWRTGLKMGYGHEPISSIPADAQDEQRRFQLRPTAIDWIPDVLVLDDAGIGFRKEEHRACWHLSPPPSWVLLKLADPIAQGDLWRALVADDSSATSISDKLVCLVAARDLRLESVRISAGFSWERTLEDLSEELTRPALAPLARCRHLIVTFGGDGALWIDRTAKGQAVLCFEAAGIEGTFADSFDGEALGYLTTMAAALAYGMLQAPARSELTLLPWIEAGLRGMRDLLEHGHGEVGPGDGHSGENYVARLADVILTPGADRSLSVMTIAWPRPGAATRDALPPWSIVAASQRPLTSTDLGSLAGLAAAVACRGAAVYGRLPHARFGRFVTTERAEVEALRVVRGRMIDYQRHARPGEKPLSIGIFGPPGAGKSFAVREIAAAVFGNEAWLEFNLSQFRDSGDLNGAFHQARDRVLSGVIPVVFWDEFDSHEYDWLQYLLAPMQDGRFQEGPVSHAISRCVFVFAGGTAADFAGLGPASRIVDDRKWKLLKGPDFKSRFDAVYDVSGPNRRKLSDGTDDEKDVGYTLRRALLLRGQLRLGPREKLAIDPALLRAMLLVPHYYNGARSMEKLLSAMNRRPGEALRRSDIPPRDLLDMHVDAGAFLGLLDRDRGFTEGEMVESLAAEIHEHYLDAAERDRWQADSMFKRPFDALDDAGKADNRAAARRIPEVLALAGLGVEAADAISSSPCPDDEEFRLHIKHNLERLAEAEHDGWMEVRKRNNWTYGEVRDNDKRIHPLLVSYSALSESARDRDRTSVHAYPDQVRKAGYRIVWL